MRGIAPFIRGSASDDASVFLRSQHALCQAGYKRAHLMNHSLGAAAPYRPKFIPVALRRRSKHNGDRSQNRFGGFPNL